MSKKQRSKKPRHQFRNRTYWYCAFPLLNGEQKEPEVVWTHGEQPGMFTDDNGCQQNCFPQKINVRKF